MATAAELNLKTGDKAVLDSGHTTNIVAIIPDHVVFRKTTDNGSLFGVKAGTPITCLDSSARPRTEIVQITPYRVIFQSGTYTRQYGLNSTIFVEIYGVLQEVEVAEIIQGSILISPLPGSKNLYAYNSESSETKPLLFHDEEQSTIVYPKSTLQHGEEMVATLNYGYNGFLNSLTGRL